MRAAGKGGIEKEVKRALKFGKNKKSLKKRRIFELNAVIYI